MKRRGIDYLVIVKERHGENRFIAEGTKRIGRIENFFDHTDTQFNLVYNTLLPDTKIEPIVATEYSENGNRICRLAGIIHQDGCHDEDHFVSLEVTLADPGYFVEKGKLKVKK